MKCVYSKQWRSPEFDEHCEKEAIRVLTFHNGVKSYLCKEHAQLGEKIQNLIIDNQLLNIIN